MNILESLNRTSDHAVDLGEVYYRKTHEYYKLKIFQQLSTTTGMFLKIALIGIFLFLGLTLTVVAGTLALGQFLGSTAIACLLISAILFLTGLVIFRLRSKIDALVVRKMSKQFFD